METKHTLKLSLDLWQSNSCSCESHDSLWGEWSCSSTT